MFADLIALARLKEPGPDEPWPVMMMIVEFQQMGAMPYLERAIHSLAIYGGRVAMIA
jgi:type IV secretion system protein VirD4